MGPTSVGSGPHGDILPARRVDAHAVRPDDVQLASLSDLAQLLGQLRAFLLAGLREARGEHVDVARPLGDALLQRLLRPARVDGDDHEVGHFRHVGQRWVALAAHDLFGFRVDRVDGALVAHRLDREDELVAAAARLSGSAEDGDGTRREGRFKAGVPCHRRLILLTR